ncbi:hypothetical protein WA158_001805 [Blastocystis sp. Blastoise]
MFSFLKKKPSLQDQIIQIKVNGKMLESQSKQAMKRAKQHETKMKNCIKKGEMETAQVFAESMIRCKNESIQLQRTANQMEAVADVLNSQAQAQIMAGTLGTTVNALACASENLNANYITNTLKQFSSLANELGVQTQFMNEKISESQSTNTDQSEVNGVMKEAMMQMGYEVSEGFDGVPVAKPKEKEAENNGGVATSDLASRLNSL